MIAFMLCHVLQRLSHQPNQEELPAVGTRHTSILGHRFFKSKHPHIPDLFLQVGDTLEASVTVSKCSGRRTTFLTQCVLVETGQVLVDGVALAIMPQSILSSIPRN